MSEEIHCCEEVDEHLLLHCGPVRLIPTRDVLLPVFLIWIIVIAYCHVFLWRGKRINAHLIFQILSHQC